MMRGSHAGVARLVLLEINEFLLGPAWPSMPAHTVWVVYNTKEIPYLMDNTIFWDTI